MTKKHFQELAYALMNRRPDNSTVALDQWHADVRAVAEVCKRANAAFDTDRFYAACNAESYQPSMHGR